MTNEPLRSTVPSSTLPWPWANTPKRASKLLPGSQTTGAATAGDRAGAQISAACPALAHAKNRVRTRRGGGPAGAGLGPFLRERSRELRRILVRDRDRTHVVDTDTIDWIEAADYYAVLHVGGRTHLLRETMNELEQRLDPSKFFRAHRSAIVRLDRVREMQPWFHGAFVVLLEDGTELRLSRSRREHLQSLLQQTF